MSRRVPTFLKLNFSLHDVDDVGWTYFQGDGLAREGLDEDLQVTAQAQHEVEGGLLLDVVISQGTTILQLLAGKDQALLVCGDAYAKPHI